MGAPVRIRKTDTLSPHVAHDRIALVVGTPFVVAGGIFALLGFGDHGLEGANAPGWVIGAVGLSFALAGMLIFFNGLRGVRHRARRRAAAGAPAWERDLPWDPRGVRDRAGARVVHAVLASLFLAVFLVPFNYWAYLSGEGPFVVKVIVGVFDAALVLALGNALYRLGQLLKYGHSRLAFRRFPFLLGEPLEVVFSPNRFARIRFTLRCVEERQETRGTGRNRWTALVCYELWRTDHTVESGALEDEVAVAFDLPDDPALANKLDAPPIRYWELAVDAEEPGIDFATTFALPVYARSPRESATASAAPTA